MTEISLEQYKMEKEEVKKLINRQISISSQVLETLTVISDSIIEIQDIAESLDRIMEDNRLDISEINPIQKKFDKLEQILTRLSKDHKANIKSVNPLLTLIKDLEKILVEVRYLEGIESNVFDGYNEQVQYFHYLDTDAKNRVLANLKENFELRESSSKQLRFETILLDTLEILGILIENYHFDLLYAKVPKLVVGMQNQVNILKEILVPISKLLRGKYFNEMMTLAKEGIDILTQNKELEIKNYVKLRGYIKNTKGYNEVENLLRHIKSLK